MCIYLIQCFVHLIQIGEVWVNWKGKKTHSQESMYPHSSDIKITQGKPQSSLLILIEFLIFLFLGGLLCTSTKCQEDRG